MWWWIGGYVVAHLAVGFYWSYEAGKSADIMGQEPTEAQVTAVAVACVCWPVTTVMAIACALVEMGVTKRKCDAAHKDT